jgi:hypothetical protein
MSFWDKGCLPARSDAGKLTSYPPYPNLESDVLRRLLFAGYERQLNRAYRDRLVSKGKTAQGVFWRSQSSQYARFDALLSLVHQLRGYQPTSIADIGCGYGAMLDFINQSSNFRHFDYLGVDINRAMIAACRQKFPHQPDIFSTGNRPSRIVDFCLFSGTFNLTHSNDPALWSDYIFACLDRCMTQTRYGLVLNLLCTPKAQIQKQIFYTNRADFIERAETHFGPTHAQSTRHVTGDVSFVITRKS